MFQQSNKNTQYIFSTYTTETRYNAPSKDLNFLFPYIEEFVIPNVYVQESEKYNF